MKGFISNKDKLLIRATDNYLNIYLLKNEHISLILISIKIIKKKKSYVSLRKVDVIYEEFTFIL